MALEPFHIGIVTTDLATTMTALTKSTGARWSSLHSETRQVWTPQGVGDVRFEGSFTRTGPMHLELIGSVPGTLWSSTKPGELHHVGYWADDLAVESARLVERGFPVAAAG